MSNEDFSRKAISLAADPRGRIDPVKARVTRDFDRAHWRALLQDLFSMVRYHPVDLLPFEMVREKLRLSQKSYLGIQEIPLDKIVGSVGRYNDFTRTFMPRKTHTRSRWEKIDTLAETSRWPPIEVYKVSDTYFVRDGNHRVSVARQLGLDAIEAHVWEYPTRVPLETDDGLDDILVRAEYLAFLDDTHLDKLRPDQSIILTIPGGYWELEEEIAIHRHWQSLEQKKEISWAEAVVDWYDNVYLPIVQKIQSEDILSFFPGRTEADLVVWVLRHWYKLERDQGGEEMLPDDVIEDFIHKARANPFRRFLAWIERRLQRKQAGEKND